MATQTGLTHLFGFQMGTMTFIAKNGDASTPATNYVKPNIQSLGFTHSLESTKIKGTSGEYVGIILHGEMIECTFDFIPEGTSISIDPTVAGSPSKSAIFPVLGGSVSITGLPVVAAGSYSDALNTTAFNHWIYEGGGTIKGSSDSNWTGSITLKRYPGITSAVAI